MQSDYNPYVLHRLLVTQLTERYVFGKRARSWIYRHNISK